MPLGMDVGGPGDIVLDGGPSSSPRKGAQQPPPTFRPTLLSHGRPSELLLIVFRSIYVYLVK